MRIALAVALVALVVGVAACDGDDGAPAVDAAPGGAWSQELDVPRAVIDPGVAALGTNLVVVGGVGADGAASDRVDVYDTLGRAWSALPAVPAAMAEPSAVAVAGTLYVVGVAGAWRLSPGAAGWTPIAAPPAGLARDGAGVVVSAPHLYLFGGATAGGAVASCLAYDLTTDTWAQLPDLPAPRHLPMAMRRSDNGALIVAGGEDGSGAATDVWELRVGASAWVAKASLPSARGDCAYGAVGDALYCAGGEGESGAAVADVVAYATVGDAWTSRPAMPAPRTRAAGATIGTSLYVVGGAAASQPQPVAPTSTLYRFDVVAP